MRRGGGPVSSSAEPASAAVGGVLGVHDGHGGSSCRGGSTGGHSPPRFLRSPLCSERLLRLALELLDVLLHPR
eukprot:7852671-Alexandrium_andersonii.AAC.1